MGSIPAESTIINILAKNNMMNLRQEISPEMPKYEPEFEVDKELTEEEREISESVSEENKKQLSKILESLKEYEDFYNSLFVKKTRKAPFGFNKYEQDEILNIAEQNKEVLTKVVSGGEIEITADNQFKHIIGNSAVVFGRAKARRYEESKDDQRKSVFIEDAYRVRREMKNLNFYLKETAKDKNLLKKELTSDKGYLENFLDYLNCDLPVESQKRLLLFRFFRNMEDGKIKDYKKAVQDLNKELRKNPQKKWEQAPEPKPGEELKQRLAPKLREALKPKTEQELVDFINSEKLAGDLVFDKVFKTYKLEKRF